MKIDFEEKGNTSIIKFSGEFSVFYQEEIENSIFSLIDKGNNNVIFDMTDVNYLDSSGISVIVTTGQKIKQKLRLVNCQPNVKYVLDLAEIEAIIEYHDSINNAISSFN